MFSVVGNQYSEQDFHLVDLSISNLSLRKLNSQSELTDYINQQTYQAAKTVAYGGYCEERDFYLKSSLFSGAKRTFHLGVDVWLPVGHPVYVATSAKVYGKAYNSLFLDYGYTVILEHDQEGEKLFSLYGHLGSKDFDSIAVGDIVTAGDIVGYVGDEAQNGGWAPHLHFQLIKDLEGNVSDYPGVCHTSKSEAYVKNCPDPISWIIVK